MLNQQKLKKLKEDALLCGQTKLPKLFVTRFFHSFTPTSTINLKGGTNHGLGPMHCVCMCVRACVRAYVRACVRMYVHTCIHIYVWYSGRLDFHHHYHNLNSYTGFLLLN